MPVHPGRLPGPPNKTSVNANFRSAQNWHPVFSCGLSPVGLSFECRLRFLGPGRSVLVAAPGPTRVAWQAARLAETANDLPWVDSRPEPPAPKSTKDSFKGYQRLPKTNKQFCWLYHIKEMYRDATFTPLLLTIQHLLRIPDKAGPCSWIASSRGVSGMASLQESVIHRFAHSLQPGGVPPKKTMCCNSKVRAAC